MFIRKEEPADVDAIRQVNRQAFGQEEEGNRVDKLRNKNKSVVSLVAVEGNKVIGHIIFSPVMVVGERDSFPAVALAPMSVLPEY